MRRILRFCLFIVVILSPAICLPWAEAEHPITELLIQKVYLDTNYVFCGSDASWGTNLFGLFVFDRRTQTWTNYSGLRADPGSIRKRQVRAIEPEGEFVYVTYHGGVILRFSRHDGSYERVPKSEAKRRIGFALTIDGIDYRVHKDSVIVGSDPNVEAYTPSAEQIPAPVFNHPVADNKRIYMPYDFRRPEVIATGTVGIALFDTGEKTFYFYRSNRFKGTVTGSFVYDSLIILPTAKFIYEHNAAAAAGFVAFNPSDFTFSIWKGLSLPDEPLAIFQVAHDEKEYWIGTDMGVFRVDKRTNKTSHYQITKGIVSSDTVNVHYNASYSSKVLTKFTKGKEVELLGVYDSWCEIRAPQHITGWIEAKYITNIIHDAVTNKSFAKFIHLGWWEWVPVSASADSDEKFMTSVTAYSSKHYEYEVVGTEEMDEVIWYEIKLPTAWINMNDLIFHLGEVE